MLPKQEDDKSGQRREREAQQQQQEQMRPLPVEIALKNFAAAHVDPIPYRKNLQECIAAAIAESNGQLTQDQLLIDLAGMFACDNQLQQNLAAFQTSREQYKKLLEQQRATASATADDGSPANAADSLKKSLRECEGAFLVLLRTISCVVLRQRSADWSRFDFSFDLTFLQVYPNSCNKNDEDDDAEKKQEESRTLAQLLDALSAARLQVAQYIRRRARTGTAHHLPLFRAPPPPVHIASVQPFLDRTWVDESHKRIFANDSIPIAIETVINNNVVITHRSVAERHQIPLHGLVPQPSIVGKLHSTALDTLLVIAGESGASKTQASLLLAVHNGGFGMYLLSSDVFNEYFYEDMYDEDSAANNNNSATATAEAATKKRDTAVIKAVCRALSQQLDRRLTNQLIDKCLAEAASPTTNRDEDNECINNTTSNKQIFTIIIDELGSYHHALASLCSVTRTLHVALSRHWECPVRIVAVGTGIGEVHVRAPGSLPSAYSMHNLSCNSSVSIWPTLLARFDTVVMRQLQAVRNQPPEGYWSQHAIDRLVTTCFANVADTRLLSLVQCNARFVIIYSNRFFHNYCAMNQHWFMTTGHDAGVNLESICKRITAALVTSVGEAMAIFPSLGAIGSMDGGPCDVVRRAVTIVANGALTIESSQWYNFAVRAGVLTDSAWFVTQEEWNRRQQQQEQQQHLIAVPRQNDNPDDGCVLVCDRHMPRFRMSQFPVAMLLEGFGATRRERPATRQGSEQQVLDAVALFAALPPLPPESSANTSDAAPAEAEPAKKKAPAGKAGKKKAAAATAAATTATAAVSSTTATPNYNRDAITPLRRAMNVVASVDVAQKRVVVAELKTPYASVTSLHEEFDSLLANSSHTLDGKLQSGVILCIMNGLQAPYADIIVMSETELVLIRTRNFNNHGDCEIADEFRKMGMCIADPNHDWSQQRELTAKLSRICSATSPPMPVPLRFLLVVNATQEEVAHPETMVPMAAANESAEIIVVVSEQQQNKVPGLYPIASA